MSKLPDVITFEIIGRPAPQGSKVSQVIYRRTAAGPQPVTKGGRVLTTTRDSSENLVAWRQGVAAAARAAYDGPLLTGPVALDVTFYRPRPKSHFGAGRNAGKRKETAPPYPLPKPDSLKLRRAVEDSLAGVVYRDDAQIVDGSDHKRYGECYRTVVRVTALSGAAEREKGADG